MATHLAASEDAASVIKRATVRKLAAPLDASAEDAQLLGQVIEYYHQTLLQSPEALGYLKQRGIASMEAIRTFKLGFANRTLGYRLPQKNRLEGQELRGRLQRIGIYRASGHEHFNGSLVIPIINTQSEVTEVYGRKITAGLRESTPLHLYLPGPHRGVWNAAALGNTPEIILCEALIDALTFWCAGFRNVTASFGVESFTADHLALLKQCGAQRVFIAYDRDGAGDRAAEKLAEKLLAEGVECYRVLFPKGIDANEYALKVTPAARSLALALRSAHWLGKGARPAPVIPEPNLPVANDLPPALQSLSSPSSLAAAAAETTPAAEEQTQTIGTSSVDPSAPIVAAAAAVDMTDALIEVRELGQAAPGQLKVNVLVSRSERFHVDTLDLYCARLRAATCGCWLALMPWRELKLDEFWAAKLLPSRKGTRWDEVLAIFTVYRLLSPGSEWRLHRQWYGSCALADLLASPEAIDEQVLYRCHDRLLEHKQALFDYLIGRWRHLFNVGFDVLLYDFTSTYFEIDPPLDEEGKRQFDYSRDHRSDCVTRPS